MVHAAAPGVRRTSALERSVLRCIRPAKGVGVQTSRSFEDRTRYMQLPLVTRLCGVVCGRGDAGGHGPVRGSRYIYKRVMLLQAFVGARVRPYRRSRSQVTVIFNILPRMVLGEGSSQVHLHVVILENGEPPHAHELNYRPE